MVWLVLERENLRKVLVMMALASLNPNKEWSVNTVGISKHNTVTSLFFENHLCKVVLRLIFMLSVGQLI